MCRIVKEACTPLLVIRTDVSNDDSIEVSSVSAMISIMMITMMINNQKMMMTFKG